ncbi:FimB/Mfa2 family fimbrial subunit [Deinococcus peraridilitoris]|uniref:DUF3324 domain-containing protein n=1 Tax=Deinococcus peraridilitoris (strain DSM 19664 / LMG 22246 / CIP 109416 / KR-200) TaxID=937777 RepID=L0A0B9_DEIPD|nr:FimB/Mfa2 family fimbrial subunit [Deinococcus peraridilitoris]AFZ67338.1 Protein of unknown function (DUF1812) [Deinococcus peraridilitoris DSM 19664]
MMNKALFALAALTLNATALAEVRLEGALTHHTTLAPGGVYKGTLTLSNPSEAPARATISLTDYHFQADGTTSHDPAGTLPRSNSKWIALDTHEVTLPAKSKMVVHYTLTAPANAIGTYWSAIHVTPELPPATGSGLTVRNRISFMVQVVADLPGGDTKVRFNNPQLLRDEQGKLAFSVDTHAESERWIVRKLTLEAFDDKGKLAATVTSRYRRLYPGTSLRDTFALDLPNGKYTLVVIADDEAQDHAFGARYQVEVR